MREYLNLRFIGRLIIALILVQCNCCNSTRTVLSHNCTKFVCNSSVSSHPEMSHHIDCIFQFCYTGDVDPNCMPTANKDGMGIVIQPSALLLNYSIFEFPTIKCSSDLPIDIKINSLRSLDYSHFTDIRRKRIVGTHHKNKTTYDYQLEVRFSKFQSYLRFTKEAAMYHIFTIHPATTLKSNILFLFGKYMLKFSKTGDCEDMIRDLCGFLECRTVITLPTLLSEEFVDIPVFSFSRFQPLLSREICKYKSEWGKCKDWEGLPPKFCVPYKESLKFDKANRIKYNGTDYGYLIPFGVLVEALQIKSDNLNILDFDSLSEEKIEEIAKLSRKQIYRIFVNQQDRIYYDGPLKYITIQQNNSNSNCLSQNALSFDALLYILQLLGVRETLALEKEEFSFIPLVGFKIQSQFLLNYGPGNFHYGSSSCSKFNYFSIDFFSRPFAFDAQYLPSKYDILTGGRKQDNLMYSCSSKSGNATFDIEISKNVSWTPFNNATVLKSMITSIHHDYKSFALLRNFDTSPAKKIACKTTEARRRAWFIEFGDSLGNLRYSSKDDLFYCTSYSADIKHWRCNNRFQCHMVASKCLYDIQNDGWEPDGSTLQTRKCDYTADCMKSLRENIPQDCFETPNWISGNSKFRDCKATKPLEMGVVQCIHGYSPSILRYDSQLIYFRGFDNILYMDTKINGPPPKNAILKITTFADQSIFYTNKEYTFTCEAHCFFYDDGILWFLKYKNETLLPAPIGLVEDVQNRNLNISNSISELRLFILDTSLKEVFCSAPYFNSTDWNNVSTQIEVIESTVPKITTVDTDLKFSESLRDQGITCHASGLPQPKILWSRPNSKIEKPALILNENFLLFPIYNSSFLGEYICTAVNLMGNDTKSFFVETRVEGRESLIYTIIGTLITFVVFFSVLFVLYLTNEKRKRYREMKEIIDLLNGSKSETEKDDKLINSTNFLFDTNYDLKKHSFIVDEKYLLGKGAFGEVYRGLLEGINKAVAFKTVRPNGGMAPLKALVSEAKILMYIGPHEHLVTLLGVYRQDIRSGAFYVAIEFCELGSLESFLRKQKSIFLGSPISNSKIEHGNVKRGEKRKKSNRKRNESGNDLRTSLCTIQSLLMWSEQIAMAMEYLGTKNVIHSDLATRNVLLTSEGNAKVTDFGLSRRTYNYTEYVKKAKDPLPWRWLSIESLQTNTFSVKSDMWAYGITLWEIFSLGDVPYPGMDFTIEFIQELENGLRNFKPKLASDEMSAEYDIMARCWHLDPEQRPTFSSMKKIFNYAITSGLGSLTSVLSPLENLEEISLKFSSEDYTEI